MYTVFSTYLNTHSIFQIVLSGVPQGSIFKVTFIQHIY